MGENSESTFGGQSTYLLPVAGREETFIAMFDLWRPENAIDGRYMWLPVEFEDERIVLRYRDAWDLSVWDLKPVRSGDVLTASPLTRTSCLPQRL